MSILNYFQNLPFDIQEHIWKIYYSNNVLNEINNNFIRKRDYYYPVNDRWSLKGYYRLRLPGSSKLRFEYDEMFEEFNRDQEEEIYEEQFREAYGDINDEFKRIMEIEDESDEEV